MKLREALIAGTAVGLLAGCSGNLSIPQSSSSSVTHQARPIAKNPDIGRNSWPSDLRYAGKAAKYLLAINCDTDPQGSYSATLARKPQRLDEALTVGATAEQIPNDEHDMTATADFLGGLTIRRYNSVSLEYARSDDQPGYADTVRGGGSVEYVPIPGKPYIVAIGADPESGNITLSCEPSPINPIPESTPSVSPSQV